MTEVPAVQAYNMLRRLTIEGDQIQQQIEQLQNDLNANLMERRVIADSIMINKFVSDDGSILSPHYKTRKQDAVKTDEFKAKHPDIFDRCNPYVDSRGALDVVEAKFGVEGAQEFLKVTSPETYREVAKVKIADVRNAITPAERITLQEEGILYEKRFTVGEPRWEPATSCAASMKRLAAEKQTKPDEDDDDDE